MLTISPLPPASDMMIEFCPAGPTSKISTSSGNVWLIPVRSTVTLVTLPDNPETRISDGYGLAIARSLIVMAAVLEKLAGVHAGVPVKIAVAVAVAVDVDVDVAVAVAVLVAVLVGVIVAVLVGVPVFVGVDVEVGVPATQLSVTMCNVQPPLMLPTSAVASSRT